MKYCFKVPCKKDKLKEIRCFVKDVLSKHGLSEIDISTLVLAIDEVCANVIIHSHCCNPKESIEIEICVDKETGLIFNIIDNSEMFDIKDYQEPTLDDIVKTKRKGGIGLILVKRIMDDIQVIAGKNKNVCRLVKKIKVD